MWLGDPNISSTWELASNLPSALVEDFEQGIQYDISRDSYSSAGETFHTITAKSVQSADERPSKRTRLDMHVDT